MRTQGPVSSGIFCLHFWPKAASKAGYNSATPSASAWKWLWPKNKRLKTLVSGRASLLDRDKSVVSIQSESQRHANNTVGSKTTPSLPTGEYDL